MSTKTGSSGDPEKPKELRSNPIIAPLAPEELDPTEQHIIEELCSDPQLANVADRRLSKLIRLLPKAAQRKDWERVSFLLSLAVEIAKTINEIIYSRVEFAKKACAQIDDLRVRYANPAWRQLVSDWKALQKKRQEKVLQKRRQESKGSQ